MLGGLLLDAGLAIDIHCQAEQLAVSEQLGTEGLSLEAGLCRRPRGRVRQGGQLEGVGPDLGGRGSNQRRKRLLICM